MLLIRLKNTPGMMFSEFNLLTGSPGRMNYEIYAFKEPCFLSISKRSVISHGLPDMYISSVLGRVILSEEVKTF